MSWNFTFSEKSILGFWNQNQNVCCEISNLINLIRCVQKCEVDLMREISQIWIKFGVDGKIIMCSNALPLTLVNLSLFGQTFWQIIFVTTLDASYC